MTNRLGTYDNLEHGPHAGRARDTGQRYFSWKKTESLPLSLPIYFVATSRKLSTFFAAMSKSFFNYKADPALPTLHETILQNDIEMEPAVYKKWQGTEADRRDMATLGRVQQLHVSNHSALQPTTKETISPRKRSATSISSLCWGFPPLSSAPGRFCLRTFYCPASGRSLRYG